MPSRTLKGMLSSKLMCGQVEINPAPSGGRSRALEAAENTPHQGRKGAGALIRQDSCSILLLGTVGCSFPSTSCLFLGAQSSITWVQQESSGRTGAAGSWESADVSGMGCRWRVHAGEHVSFLWLL